MNDNQNKTVEQAQHVEPKNVARAQRVDDSQHKPVALGTDAAGRRLAESRHLNTRRCDLQFASYQAVKVWLWLFWPFRKLYRSRSSKEP